MLKNFFRQASTASFREFFLLLKERTVPVEIITNDLIRLVNFFSSSVLMAVHVVYGVKNSFFLHVRPSTEVGNVHLNQL